jgi:opacity protein-like surface antigen
MTKLSILTVLVMVLCLSPSSYAADAAGHSWYVGIGGSWAMENVDTDDVEDGIDEYVASARGVAGLGPDVDLDDGFGFNARVGYHINDNLSIAFVFDYLIGFDSDESKITPNVITSGLADLFPGVSGTAYVEAEMETDVMTFMVEGKYSIRGDVRPYAVVGLGLMNADVDGKIADSVIVDRVPIERGSLSFSDSDTTPCGKIGLGVDWFATPNVSVGLEGSYVLGFGDHEVEDVDVGISYFNIGFGIAHHW